MISIAFMAAGLLALQQGDGATAPLDLTTPVRLCRNTFFSETAAFAEQKAACAEALSTLQALAEQSPPRPGTEETDYWLAMATVQIISGVLAGQEDRSYSRRACNLGEQAWTSLANAAAADTQGARTRYIAQLRESFAAQIERCRKKYGVPAQAAPLVTEQAGPEE